MKPLSVKKLKLLRLLCAILSIASFLAIPEMTPSSEQSKYVIVSNMQWALMLISFVAAFALIPIEGFLQRSQREAAMKGEKNSLGTLLDTFFNGNTTFFTPAVRYQLIRLLPKVGAEEVSRSSRGRRSKINKLLVNNDRALRISALKFVAQWGDAQFISCVQRIVDEREDDTYKIGSVEVVKTWRN